VPLHHPIHHGQTEAGAALSFGGKERLETAASRLLVHADAGVRHLHVNLLPAEPFSEPRRMVSDSGSQRQRTAFRHGIDCVENEVDQRFADLALDPHDRRQSCCQVGHQLNHDSPLLWHVAPPGACEVYDLLGQTVQLHRR
jgi:hypothetical protein